MKTPPTQSSSRWSAWLPWPGRVRVWHFIALPAVAMGVAIFLGRFLETLLNERLGPTGIDILSVTRVIVVTLLMATLIAWLAVGYRRQYEVELQARNKELEETKDFLSNIIQGSGEAIVTLDKKGRVSSWNAAAERIFGWTAGEMVGKTFRRLLPGDPHIIEERARVGRMVREGKTVRDYQTIRVRKDGTKIIVRITWAPIYDRTGEFEGVVGIVLDVTAEIEMKQRLVEQERLAAVGEMAAQVAHEVRNPLAGIRGACEMVFRGSADLETRKEVGDEVVRQIDRLNRTVGELLQFAVPKATERVPSDLNELIGRVAGMLQEDPRARTVTLVREFDEKLPPVRLDPSKIEQVLYNLLLNALQMMEYEGTITVGTAVEEDRVSITVRDTGPGIPVEVGHEIFKPFVTTRTTGTGLGLAIVRKIIDAHDGSVDASTLEEGGAEFRVFLPIGRPVASA